MRSLPRRKLNSSWVYASIALASLVPLQSCDDTTLGPIPGADADVRQDSGFPAPRDAGDDARAEDASTDALLPRDASADRTLDDASLAPSDCSSRRLCEDFESDTAGAAPDPSRWEVVFPNCSGTGTVEIDNEVAASGSQSLRVNGPAGYCNHVFASPRTDFGPISTDLWVRFRVRFESALTYDHVTFLTMPDATDGKDIRMGGQSQILMWNKEIDDATLPELSPTGIAASVRPTPGTWYCVEYHLDGAAGTLDTYVDEARIEGLSADGVGTRDFDGQWYRRSWSPSITDLRLGWESYGGAAMTLWFDDIAADATRIGCDS